MTENRETISKTVRLDTYLVDKIEKMSKEAERDFSKQLRWMLYEYIRIKENK